MKTETAIVLAIAAGAAVAITRNNRAEYGYAGNILKTPWESAEEWLKKQSAPDWQSATVLTKPEGYWNDVCALFGGCK